MVFYLVLGLVIFTFAARATTPMEAHAWLGAMYISFSAELYLLLIALTEDTQEPQLRRTLSDENSPNHLAGTEQRRDCKEVLSEMTIRGILFRVVRANRNGQVESDDGTEHSRSEEQQ
jgi:hypothetical protein